MTTLLNSKTHRDTAGHGSRQRIHVAQILYHVGPIGRHFYTESR